MSKSRDIHIQPSRANQSSDEQYVKSSSEYKRDEWRKVRELEEARKTGSTSAFVDEEGQDINSHFPQNIPTVPCYVTGVDRLTLNQVKGEKKDVHSGIDQWYKQAVLTSNKELKASQLEDEMITRKQTKEQEKTDIENSEDEDNSGDVAGTNFESKRRVTKRKLRIREDIPKYLCNLDPNSAYYDPKTRSLPGNPFKDPNSLYYDPKVGSLPGNPLEDTKSAYYDLNTKILPGNPFKDTDKHPNE